jgi:hypothetical protein
MRNAAHLVLSLGLFWFATPGICTAQDLCSLPAQAQGFAPPEDVDAYTVLDTIGKIVPFQTRTVSLWPSSSSLVRQRGGAAAQICNGTQRWIFYDPAYIDAIKRREGKSDLPRYFVLAHEAAHHVNGDTLNEGNWNKDQELAADYSAAVWLTRLGVSREELLGAFDALQLPVQSVNGYPTRAERRAKVIEGSESISPGEVKPSSSSANETTDSSANDSGTCSIAASLPPGVPPQRMMVRMDGHSIGLLSLHHAGSSDSKDFDCTSGYHVFELTDQIDNGPTGICSVGMNVVPGTVYDPIILPSDDKKQAQKGVLKCTMKPVGTH